MRQYFILFISTLLVFGCNRLEVVTLDTSVKKEAIWRNVEPNYYAQSKIFTNAIVSENELRLASTDYFYRFNGGSNLIEGSYSLGITGSPYYRSVFSHNLFAIMTSNKAAIQIAYCQEPILSQSIVGLTLNSAISPNYEKYSQFNVSNFIGAFNTKNQFITAVILKTAPQSIRFIQIQTSLQSPYYLSIVPNSEKEIVLPDEPSNKVYSMESFQSNFLVSTSENSYIVRPDGTFKQIFPQRAFDYFFWQGKVYADLGNKMYASANDGEDWYLVKDNLNLPTPREFAPIQDELVCYKDDSLFRVNTQDFTYKSLKNNGLTSNKITSASFFLDSVYVGTWNGLYVKSKKDCFYEK